MALAAALLAAVLWYGAGRGGRLRRFARRHGGDYSPHDAFDLQPTVDQLYDDRYVGHAARLDDLEADEDSPSPLYLCELHPRARGLARSTVALSAWSTDRPDAPRIIRARMPSSDLDDGASFANNFAVDGGESDDVPSALTDILSERLDELDWLPEVRLGDEHLAVGSRERVLAGDEEWDELLELALAVKRALESE